MPSHARLGCSQLLSLASRTANGQVGTGFSCQPGWVESTTTLVSGTAKIPGEVTATDLECEIANKGPSGDSSASSCKPATHPLPLDRGRSHGNHLPGTAVTKLVIHVAYISCF